MTPENMLKEGRLEDALQGLTAQVRGNPADAKARVFLFQLLKIKDDLVVYGGVFRHIPHYARDSI